MDISGDAVPRPAAGDWVDLPAELWHNVINHLLSIDRLYSVACSAQDIYRLSQVCRALRRLTEPAWASLCSACPAMPQCPLTCLPFVYGLDSSKMGDRGVFCVSPHGRALDWGVVSHELHRGSASQITFGPHALQASLLALGVKQAASWGDADCAKALQTRLPQQAMPGSTVPYVVALEVRRLRCCSVSAVEAKRTYALTDRDLKVSQGADRNLPARRTRHAKYRLLDVLAIARSKYGTAAAMHARSRPQKAMPLPRLSRDMQMEFVKKLQARGLRWQDGGIVCLRYMHGERSALEQGLDQVVAAAERHSFIARFCSAEHKLALSGCSWAAMQDSRQSLADSRLLAMEERAQRDGLSGFVCAHGNLDGALSNPDLPESMRGEVAACFRQLGQASSADSLE